MPWGAELEDSAGDDCVTHTAGKEVPCTVPASVISVLLAAPEESLQESSSGQPWVEITGSMTVFEPKVKGTSFLDENKRCNHLERQWKFLILNDFLGMFNLPIILHSFFSKEKNICIPTIFEFGYHKLYVII